MYLFLVLLNVENSSQLHIVILLANQNVLNNVTTKYMHYINLRVVIVWWFEYTGKYHLIFSTNFSINNAIVWFHRFSKWSTQQFGDLSYKIIAIL